MADYTFKVGETVTFLTESGNGVIQSIRPDGIHMVLTEDDFEMPYPASALVPRFDLKADEKAPEPKKKGGPLTEMGGFKVGMRVLLMDQEDTGVIQRFFPDGRAELELEDLFVERHHIDTLVLIDDKQLKELNKSIEEVSLQEIGEDIKRTSPQKSLKDRKDQGVWEVDLHIQELVDNSYGMMKHEIIQLQLDHFDGKLNQAINSGLKKIIFIHGRGEGRLRNAIREVLKRYPNCECMDADYQRYGVGATEVRIKYRPKAED